MGRLPPNKPSRHRKQNPKSNQTSRSQSSNTERAVGRFYSSHSLAESDHQEREIDRASTSSTTGTPRENRRDIDAESTLTITTPPPSTSTSSSNSTPVAIIPRAPGRNNANRCLEQLNLASMRDSGETGDLVAKLEAFFESQRQSQEDFNNRMEHRVLKELRKERENTAPPPPKCLSKELTANVREVYKSLTGADGEKLAWDVSKSFADPINKTVNDELLNGIRSTDPETPTNTVKAAMRVHFKTKKRQQKVVANNKQNEFLKEQQKRSRKNMKRTNRKKALRESTSINEADKEKFRSVLTADYMSSEESLSEPDSQDAGDTSGSDQDVPKKKKLCVRPLPWRSVEVNTLIVRLDRKIIRKRTPRSSWMSMERTVGPPSTREAPEDAPEFALLALHEEV
ncbi:NKAP family protein CG6066-like [Montipora capricornis]|uniref:NKAP family protein CG6066-like n=1 Tax=Montipora capricornis TaxID=246305 RepID=UPI0035F17EF7